VGAGHFKTFAKGLLGLDTDGHFPYSAAHPAFSSGGLISRKDKEAENVKRRDYYGRL
jgi:hypothetical protein